MGVRHARRHNYPSPMLVDVVDCDDGVQRAVMRIPEWQVRNHMDGPWHRRGVIRAEFACGELMFDEATIATRDAKLDDNLCEICFTPHEQYIGKAAAESHRIRIRSSHPYGNPDWLKKDPK